MIDVRAERYDILSISLHWLIACGVIAEAVIGFLFYKLKFGTPAYDAYYYWHRSIGELVFILVSLSLIWRRIRPPVTEFRDIVWRKSAAKFTHNSILGLLVLVPVVKIWRDAYGIGWAFFPIEIPAPFPANAFMGAVLSTLHFYLAIALLFLSGVHAAAALWHGLIERDGLTKRMGT